MFSFNMGSEQQQEIENNITVQSRCLDKKLMSLPHIMECYLNNLRFVCRGRIDGLKFMQRKWCCDCHFVLT
jgi:hypothetical protein